MEAFLKASVKYVRQAESMEDKLDGPQEIEAATRRLRDESQDKYTAQKEKWHS